MPPGGEPLILASSSLPEKAWPLFPSFVSEVTMANRRIVYLIGPSDIGQGFEEFLSMRETVPYPGVWELLSDQYAYVVLRPLRVWVG